MINRKSNIRTHYKLAFIIITVTPKIVTYTNRNVWVKRVVPLTFGIMNEKNK